jgi:hypothetical protein
MYLHLHHPPRRKAVCYTQLIIFNNIKLFIEEFKTETRIYKIIPPTELYRPLRPRSEYLLDAVVNFKMAEEIRTILMWLLKDFQ